MMNLQVVLITAAYPASFEDLQKKISIIELLSGINMLDVEIMLAFTTKDEFDFWQNKNQAFDIKSCISRIEKLGIDSKFFGQIVSGDINIKSNNYREHLLAHGLNSRQRAVLELLAMEGADSNTLKIYAPEAVTQLALTLRGRYPYFIGSEYAPDERTCEKLFPIVCEDLQSLSKPSDAFDVVLSCDVLEHVPDIYLALSEMARILKPGGMMLSTHPFTWSSSSFVKASVLNDILTYRTEPEYHGNPIDTNGSLVFTIPGWDILDTCKKAGFNRVEMVMIASTKLGIFGSSPPLVNVLRAYKA